MINFRKINGQMMAKLLLYEPLENIYQNLKLLYTNILFMDSSRLNGYSNPKKKVVILGAGIAGLIAGYELKKRGYSVIIYEGNNRVGGRIYTKHFGSGLYGELGAMRIPTHHHLVLHYINTFNLSHKLSKFKTVFSEENCYITLGGIKCRISKAIETLSPIFFPDKTRYKSPLTIKFITALKIIVETISSKEIRVLFEEDLKNDLIERIDTLIYEKHILIEHDNISFKEVLKHIEKIPKNINPPLRLFLKDIALETNENLYQLEGGMSQLPEALSKELNDSIHLNCPVTRITILENKVAIEFESKKVVESEYVICTLPFSVLNELNLKGFSASKLDAIHCLKYTNATKIIFHCKSRFWENETHQINGGASIFDKKLRQIYYPHYKHNTTEGVLLASYAIGEDADEFSNCIEQGKYGNVIKLVGELHKEINQPKMILEEVGISWKDNKWTKGGCAVLWDQSDNMDKSEKFYQNIIKAEKNLLFAGEHCSRKQAWIEGAIESALIQVEFLASQFPINTNECQS